MLLPIRRVRLAVVILAGLLLVPGSFSQTRVAPANAAPRLVLAISIDQMRFDYLTRFGPLFKGGFKMLLDGGAVFTNANYRHASTETGPGHSVILSGRHPSHSGIVGNLWYDAALKKFVNVVDDAAQAPIGGQGAKASPANAIGQTLGDVLKARNPQSRVVGVSFKDRSAILMAGSRADGAYWFESAEGAFITSSYYMNEAPSWLVQFNVRHPADAYAGQTWNRLLPDAALYEKYAGPDKVDSERDGKDTVFPHVFQNKPPDRLFYDELRRTPFADELTAAFALEVMKAHHIGEDAITDILAIGFSGGDYIGHSYGPDSQETMDQFLRLDLVLGKLFKEIDARVGLRNTVIVLTADHGASPLIENLQAAGVDAKRVNPNVLSNAVKEALDKRFPGPGSLFVYSAPDFYWNDEVIQQRGVTRKDIEAAAIAVLMETNLVERVYTAEELTSAAPTTDPFLPLFRNAYFPSRSPQLNVLLKKNVYLSSTSQGTGHGTAYDYDRHIPIIFMGPGVTPGRYMDDCGPEDIAPTLGAMLGIEFPRESDSRLLTEMLTPTIRQ
jgi:predicted AlkP superfamily pyrophosphatase or phosphodiesterase